jgi:hypothetical protein
MLGNPMQCRATIQTPETLTAQETLTARPAVPAWPADLADRPLRTGRSACRDQAAVGMGQAGQLAVPDGGSACSAAIRNR